MCMGVDSSFTDPGATAIDNCDGILTDSIKVSGTLDSSTAGTYTLLYTVSDAAANIANVYRYVNVVAVTIANFNSAATGVNQITFADLSTSNPTSWLWDFGDLNGSTLQNPTPHTYVSSGDYTVCLTAENCGGRDSICKVVTAVTGIDELDLDKAISIHPNPSEGVINLDIALLHPEDLTIKLYNVIGETIFLIRKDDLIGKNRISIDLSGYPIGIYMLEVKNDKGVTTKKITLAK